MFKESVTSIRKTTMVTNIFAVQNCPQFVLFTCEENPASESAASGEDICQADKQQLSGLPHPILHRIYPGNWSQSAQSKQKTDKQMQDSPEANGSMGLQFLLNQFTHELTEF